MKSFSGSDLERYFNNIIGSGPVLYLRLNLYANQRFPHNPVFVHNLLAHLPVASHPRSRRMGSVVATALV